MKNILLYRKEKVIYISQLKKKFFKLLKHFLHLDQKKNNSGKKIPPDKEKNIIN
jgi:hypothetical protein